MCNTISVEKTPEKIFRREAYKSYRKGEEDDVAPSGYVTRVQLIATIHSMCCYMKCTSTTKQNKLVSLNALLSSHSV